jgi:serine/threonine protein kinase
VKTANAPICRHPCEDAPQFSYRKISWIPFNLGQSGGFFYLLMEFVDGVNLRQAMQTGRFTPQQAMLLVPKICEALRFAYDGGILHRDIKPENILLDTRGRVKIADLSIAKLIG